MFVDTNGATFIRAGHRLGPVWGVGHDLVEQVEHFNLEAPISDERPLSGLHWQSSRGSL